MKKPKSIKHRILALSFRTKLLVTIFVINLVIVLLSVTIFLFSASEQMHMFNRDITAQGVEYLGDNLRELTLHMKEISETLVLDPTLLNSATPSAEGESFEQQLHYNNYLQKLINNNYYNNIPIYSTIYYDEQPVYMNQNYRFSTIEQLSETGITRDELITTDVYWTGMFSSKTPGFDADGRYLGGVRSLINYNVFGHLGGAICVYVSESDVRDLLNSLRSSIDACVLLADSDGRIISSTSPDQLFENFSDMYSVGVDELDGMETLSLYDGKKYHVNSYYVDITDWTLVAFTPVGNIVSSGDVPVEAFLIFVVCLLAVIIVIDIIVSHTLNNRVKNMFNRIATAELRSDEDDEYPDFKEELKKVLMIHRTLHDKNATLTERILEEELALKNATLSLLHAQIDSHFLYNSLDSINWMAQKHGATDIVDMVQLLSKFYRITLSKGKDVITVKEELEHTTTYLKLQQIRFESQLEFEVDYCEGLEKLDIIKLTLQPLVENAIIHGIMEKEEPSGRITVTANIVEDTLIIEISDDGVGVPQNVLDAINNDQELPTPAPFVSNGSNFGIRNIKERLKIHYKENAALTIKSDGEGTVVELKIKQPKQ